MEFLSHFINNETPTYGNKNVIQINSASCICNGESSNGLNVSLHNHVGTHVDMPKHFDDNGRNLNDFYANDWYFKRVQLLDLPLKPEEMISPQHLEGKIRKDTQALLIRTNFEAKRDQIEYWKHNPGFLPETGKWLRKEFENLQIIGFDFISLSCYQKREIGREAHKAFLEENREGNAIRIIEDMKLANAKDTISELIVAPFMLDQADGTPVTVIAF